MHWLLTTLLTTSCLAWAWSAQASEPSAESRRLAAETPLFDMHMHVYQGLTPAELEARMDRNGVRWGGGVGAVNPMADISQFKAHLGNRYYPTLGQPELAASYAQGGVAAMTKMDSPLIQRALNRGRMLLNARQAYGYGELILDNMNSHPNRSFQRRAPVDSAVVRAMFDLVKELGGIVQMHLEPHEKTLAELKAVLNDYPQVPVVISHCLAVNTSPRVLNELFEAFPQLHCELSARSQSFLPRRPAEQVFGQNFAKADWLQSIEKYPDRYMVGTDAYSSDVDYDEEIRQIRGGLLPRLSTETLQKVAHGNAKRLLKVQD